MVSYYELDFDDNYGMVIKGTECPTIYEAEEFVRKDLMGRHITGVFPIDENEARCFYDFSNEEKWPVFENHIKPIRDYKNQNNKAFYED